MRFLKFSLLAYLFAFSLNAADEPSYIFEAKGDFAKELKSLVEKYSKDENISINVYEKAPETDGGGKFLNIGVDSKRRYSIKKGAELYAKNCASCHGENGDKRAYATSAKLTKLTARDIESAFSGYLNDPEFGGRMKDIMRPISAKTTYNDLGAIIAFLKGENALLEDTSVDENSDVSTTPTQGSYLK